MVRIGITPSVGESERTTAINRDYMDAVLRAGGLPLLLPQCLGKENEILRTVDGLLFSGGADVAPECYGEERQAYCGASLPERDEMELALFRAAIARGLPILGICRGFQIINVALGGTLYQDIASQRPGSLMHPRHNTPREPVHDVTYTEGSRLYELAGAKTRGVNSRHHQGIKTLGKGLTATAIAQDGLIEGYESAEYPRMLCVQWHPESLSDRYPEAQELFNWLTREAGKV